MPIECVVRKESASKRKMMELQQPHAAVCLLGSASIVVYEQPKNLELINPPVLRLWHSLFGIFRVQLL